MSSLLSSVFMRDDPKLLQDSFYTLTNENLFLFREPIRVPVSGHIDSDQSGTNFFHLN